uniref:4-coumarate--CoA ligase n=1 Tax=Elaeis guineensis var. tenera TaxID=51953 RepID=A0A8N4EW52_ELAGV|nr:4-coumarate--CoA ligase-like 6 [Elaeis guineensis]
MEEAFVNDTPVGLASVGPSKEYHLRREEKRYQCSRSPPPRWNNGGQYHRSRSPSRRIQLSSSPGQYNNYIPPNVFRRERAKVSQPIEQTLEGSFFFFFSPTLVNSREHFTSMSPNQIQYPSFFSPETGIYTSKHPPRDLPQNPFQDLVSFLFSHGHQGATALVDSVSGLSISYPKLRDMVESMASGLDHIGISSGHVVLVLLPNTILFPVIILGVMSVGAIFTTMNPLCKPGEIKKQMSISKAELVFTFSENVGKFDGLGVRVVTVPERLDFDATEFSSFGHLLSRDPKQAPKPLIRQTDVAAILFSSGTSGPSKGVVITHANFVAMVELFTRFDASQYNTESWKNVYLAAVPMFHVYGLSLFTMGLLSLGSTVVVLRRFDPKEAIRVIDRYKVSHFPAVPPMLAALVMGVKDSSGCNLRSLRQVSCGAAPISENLIQNFLEAFPHVDFIQGYGMTESTAVGTRGFNTADCKKYTSVGLLAPNTEAKIVDLKTGSGLPPECRGELWLRGPGIMQGNTFKTWVLFKYRLKHLELDLKKIAPADLEALLICHPEILDVAVTSAEDEEAGEIPVAFVVRRPGGMLSSSEVIEYIAKQVAPYKKVRKVVFVDSIPKSAAGKVLRRLLRNYHGASKM